MIRSLIALLALTAAGSAGAATTITGAVDAPGGAAGLNGTFFHVGADATQAYDLAATLAVVAHGTPTGTFKSTNVQYNGGDQSSIVGFLGSDGASYVGPSDAFDLSDGVLHLTGYLKVDAPQTIDFVTSNDDALQVKVGDQTLFSRGCCGTTDAAAVFTTKGLYAFDLIYSNTQYNGGTGQAYVALNTGGASFVQTTGAVPEPAAWALMVAGFGLVGTAARRRTNAVAA